MGCERPPQLVVEGKSYEVAVKGIKVGETIYEFFRHPELFITPSTDFWLRMYKKKYAKKDIEDVHNCWDQCVETYESYLEGFKRGRNS